LIKAPHVSITHVWKDYAQHVAFLAARFSYHMEWEVRRFALKNNTPRYCPIDCIPPVIFLKQKNIYLPHGQWWEYLIIIKIIIGANTVDYLIWGDSAADQKFN
jgi:hypothetical protein